MSEIELQNTRNPWKKFLTLATLLALGLLIFFTRDQIVETISNIQRVNAVWLLLVVVLQALNHNCYAKVYQRLFSILGKKLRYRSMYRISLEVNFVNNVFPTAGLSGFSYFGLRMKDFGVGAGKATLVHMMRFTSVFISFQLLLFLGLLALSIAGDVSNLTILVASSLATLLLVGTVFTSYIIGSKQRIDTFFTFMTRMLNKLISVVRPKHPETINILAAKAMFLELHENYKVIEKNYKSLGRPLFYALLANITEIATILTIYMAFGNTVNPGAIIIAYVIANFAGFISVLPGGVGIYEALTTAVLATAGVPPGVSIPATIMYRVLSSAVQLPPGYYFYHKAINGSGWRPSNTIDVPAKLK